ncbi:MAG: M24 family metallopeptidase [Acidobacteria bacterium]|nr:M24 family metallopeptidase [Acidobacteriota bacterium]
MPTSNVSLADNAINMPAQRAPEIAEKLRRLRAWMEGRQLHALLLSRHENIAWATGGVDVRIGVLREVGAAHLLITPDRAFYLTTNNEEARLQTEEFAALGFEPVISAWYANDLAAAVRSLVGENELGADMPFGSSPGLSLFEVRQNLTEFELDRYRQLGKTVAEQVSSVILDVQPGMRERQIQAMLAERLIARGVLPSVYLIATDERARSYRHPVPREGELRNFGMIGLCARQWGLTVAITRFVHFGAVPSELKEKFAAVAQVNAQLLHATREGTTADHLFTVACDSYAELGYPGEERMHHQGGPTGYLEREWVARPGGQETVQPLQAFAWNPTIQGAKVEDTSILRNGKIELITATPDLPQIKTRRADCEYTSAGLLLR